MTIASYSYLHAIFTVDEIEFLIIIDGTPSPERRMHDVCGYGVKTCNNAIYAHHEYKSRDREKNLILTAIDESKEWCTLSSSHGRLEQNVDMRIIMIVVLPLPPPRIAAPGYLLRTSAR